MSGADKVVLFGSFTEDETKLFQGQPTKSEEKSWELPEIQFGSLNFSVLSLEKVSNAITEGSAHSPKPTYGHTKDLAGSSKKEAVTSTLPNGGPVLFNGFPAEVSPNNGILKNVKSEASVPSSGPVSNLKETKATVALAGPVNNVKKTEAPVPSARPVNDVKKNEALALSPGPINNVKKEATVPSAGPVNNVKKTKATSPSAGPANNVKKTEATAPSAVSANNVKKAEPTVPSARPANNVKKAEATVPSPVPVNNVKKAEATVPSPGPVNNVKKAEATVPSPGPANTVKKTESVATSVAPIKSISSSTPIEGLGPHNDGLRCTESSSSAMLVTENGSTGADAPIIAAPADESVTSLNKEAYQNKPLLPHGLKNTGNICFLNATLQAFLSCFPFVQLVQDLRNRSIPKAGYPTLSAFIELLSQFDVLDESTMKKDERFALVAAKVINPTMFDQVLRNFTPDVPAGTSARPRQEDAQEFLSFAMDRMHDELLRLNGNGSNSKEGMVVSSDDDDAWETVGRKNKSAIMRTHSFVPSDLSAIFGGKLQSVVKAAGNKASATVQPFLLLHLDIFPDAVQTLDDALHLFSTPESLEGYRTTAGKAGVVTARKSFKIHELSKIMILHLKRFSYGNRGCTKLYKPLHFPLELVLNRDLLSSPSSEGRRYELVATITHHGSGPSRGHYTADAKRDGGQWLRFDDGHVMPINVNKVLHNPAYILFYKQV
uniref:Ubiquitin carboxyl-terminal hydrolase n=2 Tax=Triticum aestivum TaxID=4565 RepID=A0A3B6D8B4_WHEAT